MNVVMFIELYLHCADLGKTLNLAQKSKTSMEKYLSRAYRLLKTKQYPSKYGTSSSISFKIKFV